MSTADSTETTSAKSSVTTATTKPRTTETTARTTPDDYEYTGTSGTTTPDWLHSQTTTESTTANSTTPDWMNSQTTTENTATNSTTPDIDKIPCGDINMDRRIDLCDAVLLNKYCAGVVSFNSIGKSKRRLQPGWHGGCRRQPFAFEIFTENGRKSTWYQH